ncbi:MAG: hypothetical protein M0Z84_02350 [Gammaproteobacteria bacterium]|nr:hypothetical protein [Gammaproteobacteria bacterium]
MNLCGFIRVLRVDAAKHSGGAEVLTDGVSMPIVGNDQCRGETGLDLPHYCRTGGPAGISSPNPGAGPVPWQRQTQDASAGANSGRSPGMPGRLLTTGSGV